MKKLFSILAVLALIAFPAVAKAITYTESLNIYQIGDTRNGPVTLGWFHFYDGSAAPEASASLTIVAEGIDFFDASLQENDQVYLNGNFLGELTQQNFYTGSFNINPGPGALGFPYTELTTSIFNFSPSLLNVGFNLVQIVVDPTSWIMEAETSTLTVNSRVPEPSTLLLLGSGLVGLGYFSKKRFLG